MPSLLIVVGTLRVPSLLKKGDKTLTHLFHIVRLGKGKTLFQVCSAPNDSKNQGCGTINMYVVQRMAMKDECCRKRHNLTECATAIIKMDVVRISEFERCIECVCKVRCDKDIAPTGLGYNGLRILLKLTPIHR